MTLREELVQIAAVTMAIIQNMDAGDTELTIGSWTDCATLVLEERIRQEARWGTRDLDDIEWSGILIEELGEWATEVMEAASDTTGEGVPIYRMLYDLADMEQPARAWLEAHFTSKGTP